MAKGVLGTHVRQTLRELLQLLRSLLPKMRSFSQTLSSIFGFTCKPVTTLVILTYLSIFAATVVIHEYGFEPPPAGPGQLGLDLNTANADLQVIARSPHPHNSERNDVVRSFIRSRVQAVADSHPEIVEVGDDLISNVTVTNGHTLAYYEGNNVLVKIEGTLSGLPAVLLSAHFDSVSTAPGATDDGMGVVTLLQLVDYFAEHQPERTLIFNINNAEEDNLWGARAFLKHAWSQLPETFLNLEGAGSGGRPLLFRTSNTKVTRAFSNVEHPHANALSADAFRWKLVRSGTDYTVYEEAGMAGLDLAFYRGRSRYHTRSDSVPVLRGTNSLWAMMEAALSTTKSLISEQSSDGESVDVVYFDVLGSAIGVFSLFTFFAVDVGLLVIGPLAVITLLFFIYFRRKATFPLTGWARFPVAFVLSSGLTTGLGVLYRYVNPYIVHSASYSVAVSMISMYYLVSFITLRAFDYFRPVHQQKLTVLLQMYVFWWALLAVATGFENVHHLVSSYFVTFFSAASLFALILALLESALLESLHSKGKVETLPTENENDYPGEGGGEYEAGGEAETTERTPLVPKANLNKDAMTEKSVPGFWMFEFWLVLELPVIWAVQTTLLVMTALGQTLTDGSAPAPVYVGLAVTCIFVVMPLSPFIHKMHSGVAVILILTLASSVLWSLFSPPFTPSTPFKIFFQQTVYLDDGSNLVHLVGIPGMIRPLASTMPSARGQEVTCHGQSFRPGLQACHWAGIVPDVLAEDSTSQDKWVTVNATRTGPHSARIEIQGAKTRYCQLEFSHNVTSVHVAGGGAEPAVGSGGVSQVQLFSRTWGKDFEVDVSWEGIANLSGNASCGWADIAEGRIPALEEVIYFLPLWATVTKLSNSLVQAVRSFDVK